MTTLVEEPTAESERPRAGIAFAVAALCFCAGIGGVVALAPSERQRPAEYVTSAPTATPRVIAPQRPIVPVQMPAPEPPASRAASPSSPASSAMPTPTEPTASVAPALAAPVEAQAPSVANAELTVIQGRVAYLRCDGLSAEGGRSPCPRDAALERAVWSALEVLPGCAPHLARGGADVRLDISRGQRTEVRVIPIAGSPEPTLDPQRVYACVGRSLTKLTTTLDPIYMMVSFRVALH